MFFKHDLEHLQFGQGRIYRILEPKNRVGNRSFKMIFSEIIKKVAAFPDKYVLTNPVSKKWIQIQFKKIPTAIQHNPPLFLYQTTGLSLRQLILFWNRFYMSFYV